MGPWRKQYYFDGNTTSWNSDIYENDKIFNVGPSRIGATYTVKVTARNSSGSSPAISDTIRSYAYDAPTVEVIQEGRQWLIDDPDAVIRWSSVKDPDSPPDYYDIDWRYKTISPRDEDRLRKIFEDLQRGNLAPQAIEDLNNEAATLLEGTEVLASSIGGDSEPRSDGLHEVTCYNEIYDFPWWWLGSDWASYCKNHVQYTGDFNYLKGVPHGYTRFDWNKPAYQVSSRQEKLIFEARVRVRGPKGEGRWSEWVFHPTARLAAGCQALQVYNNIQDIKKALAAIDIGLTVLGLGAAILSGGTSAVASQGLKKAAQILVKKIMQDVLTRKFLKEVAEAVAKNVVKNVLKNASVQAFGFMFGCIGYGVGLKPNELHGLVKEIFIEMRDTGIEKGLEGVDLDEVTRTILK